MEDHILLNGTLACILLFFTFRKWVLKGDVFHPGFIYCLINCGFFIVFAFGPYSYNFKLDVSYYYMYLLISFAFVVGIIWGDARGKKKIVKDIQISYWQLWIIYVVLVGLLSARFSSLFLESGTILEAGVNNRTQEQAQSIVNIPGLILYIIESSFIRLSSAIVTAYSVVQRRKYWRIIFLIILITLNGILLNSRTGFLVGLIPIFITTYSVLKDQGVIDFTKINWSRNFKFTVPTAIAIIFVIGTLTNVRSSIIASEYSAPYEYVESVTHLKRKAWFNNFINSQPVAIVNPIAELSIYAGSTVAHGGLVVDIAMNSSLRTWGLRNFFSVHRILFQLGLDAGISSSAVRNYFSLLAKAEAYLPFIRYSWWGFPANLIIDFGYVGAPFISLFTGWIIGWIYGCVSQGVIILKSISQSLIILSILLTPAFGPFYDFISLTTFSMLICYILARTVKIRYQKLQ